MTKRKRETADEESAVREQRKRAKTQKYPPFSEIARRLAKQEREAFQRQQQAESGRGDGVEIGKKDGNSTLSKTNEKESPGKQQTIPLTDRHESPEHGGRGGQNMIRKHKPKKKSKDRTVRSNEKKSKDVDTAAWRLSEAVGGQMLDVDPVFSPDEKFLLVAYGTSIAVYSTSTSIVVRQLRIHKADSISAFAFSSTTPGHLYLSTISGTIEKWDWTEGLRLSHWRISSSIYSLVTAKQNTGDLGSEMVYTIDRKGQGSWLLSVHRLAGVGDGAKTEVKTLFTYEHTLSSIYVFEKGRVIVATSGSQLIFGSSDKPALSPLKDVSYTWRIVDCPEYIVSTDVRVRPSERIQKTAKEGKSAASIIDVVIGGLKGSIHIYEDLPRKLIQRDHRASKGNSVDITSRRLHWHRNAVQAVKWSADGYYVISGGQETILVLWQLETGSRGYLPHLGAAIESIVVSPFGSSYGVRLSDNSAMILSTSELQPTFSIAGIQIPALQQARLPLPFVPTVTAATPKKSRLQMSRFPACASISSPGRLLLAVPPATTSLNLSMTPSNASYLQTFDVGGAHQISRQALTRTKVTTLNMGPESNILEEPNVTHIQTSYDGQWLASVDKWTPPKRDLDPFAFDQERVLEELVSREEIYLKFWSWNVEAKVWELISRIDNPHASPSGNVYDPGGVLDLVSDPVSVAFATVGEAGLVKTWKPAIRRRNGLEMKSKDGKSLRTWYCQHAIPLETTELTIKNGLLGARLAYSQDGSILAAGIQSSRASPIFIIDTYSGEIRNVHSGMYTGSLFGLGIVHKYLITLSDELRVYDLVDDKLKYGIDLPTHALSPEMRFLRSHLAVNHHDSRFAIAIPQTAKTGLESQIVIFDPADAAPQFLTHLPTAVTTLVSASGRKGFYAIDSAAQVRSIIPGQLTPSVPMILPKDAEAPAQGLHQLFGSGKKMLTEGDTSKDAGLTAARFGSAIHEPHTDNSGGAVVSQDRLAEVFDVGPASALPPVTELFEQVAALFFGKGKG